MRPPPADAAPTAGAPARPARASRIAYQPALDGLRAMAILTIMLYHGEVSWPRGGYLSVDLFFVLSGYLITTLLLAEWEARATIDLKRFWSGRARRLLPALFLMLGGIAAYAALLAPATGLARMRGDALATLLYVANWRFAFTHLSYFEQQYYLLWPLLLIAGLRLARGRLRPLLVGTLLALCASALTMAALYRPGVDPSRLYYGTDTRAQALLFGGALAVVLAMWDHRPLPRALVQVAAVVGFGGFLAMLLLIPDTVRWMYLGGFTMAAAACGLTVMVAAQPGGWVRRIFSTPPLPAIGRISYGLYLWHWPLVVAIVALLAVTTAPGRVPVAEGVALSGATGAAGLPTVTPSPTTATPTPGQPASRPNPGNAFRVYLVGDSVGFTLGFYYPRGTVRGMILGGDTELGCGLVRAPIVLAGSVQPVDPKCTTGPRPW